MKIVCLIKQVPDTELQPRVKSDESGIESDNIKYVINPYDEYGIMKAVEIKSTNPGTEIMVLSLGEDKCKERLRTALAMGCDTGILIKVDDLSQLDAMTVAVELSDYLKDKGVDIIFAGMKAVDDELGVVGAAVASLLGISVVHGIHFLELDSASGKATSKREGNRGEEVIESGLPCLFTCDKGLSEVKYPSLPAIMKAKKKVIEEIPFSNQESNSRTVKLQVPDIRREGVKIDGELAEQAKEVLRLMRDEIKIL